MTSQAYKKSSIKTIKLNHLAIIMDGNRRWAKKHKLKSNLGHKEGIKNAINILKKINNESSIKLKYITLYVFAVNNWKRSSIEINSYKSYIALGINYFQKALSLIIRMAEELTQKSLLTSLQVQ